MRASKLRILGMCAALAVGTGIALAANAPQAVLPGGPDASIAKEVRHEIVMYTHYTIFDDISFRVDQGSVELDGAVTQPYKKSDLTKIVQQIPGVTSVTNNLKVLPLSPMDDRLRMQIARAIYRDPSISTLGYQALPPIHIIVDNGHVTLEGVVNTDLQKQVAGIRAGTTGLSFGPVVNNLRVENPSPKKG
ncbi:MAG: BON domain-containing protein [Acidobacteriia bacterium]|nr:BON domain-containing protein [Terriglobia bacterium]